MLPANMIWRERDALSHRYRPKKAVMPNQYFWEHLVPMLGVATRPGLAAGSTRSGPKEDLQVRPAASRSKITKRSYGLGGTVRFVGSCPNLNPPVS